MTKLSGLLRSLATCLALAALAGSQANAAEAWDEIRATLYQQRTITDATDLVRLDAPKSAEDAAIVPIRVTVAASVVSRVRTLALAIDENPSPVAATMTFGDAYRAGTDIGDRTVEFRIRLDQMSSIRAILELDDGSLHMASRYVSGTGGCSSSSVKDLDHAMLNLGKMRLRMTADATRGADWREVQAQIRHPNFTGMQIDAKTNKYTAAYFVNTLELTIGTERLVSAEMGIAISEDPFLRMTFAAGPGAGIEVLARDTEGREFRAAAKTGGSSE